MTIVSLIIKGYRTILAVVVFKFWEGGVPKQNPFFTAAYNLICYDVILCVYVLC
jgi:hypothetical protein